MNYYEVAVEKLKSDQFLARLNRHPHEREVITTLQTANDEEGAKRWAEIETGGRAICCQFLDEVQE